jgi:ABC-type polysaccharide/polyol phosphate transport system ATPase subunit
MLARVLYPDSGSIIICGKVAPFLELGVGFQPELTAAENIYIYSSILGMSRKETNRIYDDILEFAELKRFEDMKLKSFSSGMYVRLAFSTAVHTDPDIMLVDEVLAVGDEAFQKKCMLKIRDFREQGKTIIFVSHSLGAVEELCDKAILLDNGHIISAGNAEDVASNYLTTINASNSGTSTAHKLSRNENKLIVGTDQDPEIDGLSEQNYFVLSRYEAIRSGIIQEMRIKCANPGNIKIAIYEDLDGEPGILLNSIGFTAPVIPGWNSIPFPSTPIHSNKYYWLAFCSDNKLSGTKSTSRFRRRFRRADYSSFEFPKAAGIEFTCDTENYDILAGYGRIVK